MSSVRSATSASPPTSPEQSTANSPLGVVHEGPVYVRGPDMTLSPDQLRHTHYDEMRRMINGAIEHRASEITYAEISELETPVFSQWPAQRRRRYLLLRWTELAFGHKCGEPLPYVHSIQAGPSR